MKLFVKAQTRLMSSRRAVSMLEYVLIAAVVLGIVAVLGTVLRPAVEGLLDRIASFLNG